MAEGASRYRIAKVGWGVSLRVLLRAAELIRRATCWLEGLCREVAESVASGFQALVTLVREKVFWRDFARRWFHGLYPCRCRAMLNPHNQVIKRH
jgi:hypothetical protein